MEHGRCVKMDNLNVYDSNIQIDESNVIKRVIKRIIRKCVLFIFKPYIDFQNNINLEWQKKLEQVEQEKIAKLQEELLSLEQEKMVTIQEKLQFLEQEKIADLQTRIQSLDVENKQCYEKSFKHLEKMENDLGAVARQVMLTKWKQIDGQLPDTEKSTDILTCKICGFSQERGKYETKETDCIFNGGHLVRYVCPECGVVFGPTKFLAQGPKDIDEDYWVHYLGFSEGDSSYKEERAFFMLKPDKEKVYLNYGCGHWSESLQNLRKQGYNVYGYEPYAPDIDNPYMITNKEQLEKMRFDGIYSNDVLEHMINPVEDLKFMRNILLNSQSLMSHCTGCYNYKYEYTRFHTFFYLGDSVKIMSEKSGLKVVDFCDDVEANDFICYVFAPDGEINLIDKMYVKDHAIKDTISSEIMMEKEGIIFGPYLSLDERIYKLCIEIDGEPENLTCKITADRGIEELQKFQLRQGKNEIKIALSEAKKDIEFVIENNGTSIVIRKIFFDV